MPIIVPVYSNSDTLNLLYEDIKEKLLNKIDDYEIVLSMTVSVMYFNKCIPVVGYASLMCIILTLSSLIISMLGIWVEYILRTFISSGNRPAFLIDEINKD